MGLSITSADRIRYASPQPDWVSLAPARFSIASVPLDSTAQWLDFWEANCHSAASRIQKSETKLRRPTISSDRRITLQLEQDRLIVDGKYGRILLWPGSSDNRIQWSTVDACQQWRSNARQYASSSHSLCSIAQILLSRAETELQNALEDHRYELWARPSSAMDFEIVPPDRWRLYNARPVSIRSGEETLKDGRRIVWSRSAPIDADGPNSSAIYSIHLAPTMVDNAAGEIDASSSDSATRAQFTTSPDRRKKIDWDGEVRPIAENLKRPKIGGVKQTATALRTAIQEKMKSQGVPTERIPKNTVLDDWLRDKMKK